MAKRIIHIVLSCCLAVLLLFGTTAKEYIHLFTHHTDTVDTNHHGLAFENEHHHCTFLSFTLSPFISDLPELSFSSIKFEFQEYISFTHRCIIVKTISTLSLRGPPSFLS